MENLLSIKQRYLLTAMFGVIILLLIGDVYEDLQHGSTIGHILLEGSIILISGAGILYLWALYFISSKKVEYLRKEVAAKNQSLLQWKENHSKMVKGLNETIDNQFDQWGLTPAEKDISILILKGLQLKEISEIRHTSEKTIRGQLTSIYQKSLLKNRSELQAYFLEDLFFPQNENSSDAI